MKTFSRLTSAEVLLLTVVLIQGASAQPVIDGTADAAYGPALSVQNSLTRFGDNNLGDLIATANGGSEINQVFGRVENGRLYMTVTGNLERNFNKLHIFIDSVEGGVNTIDGDIFTPEDNNVPFGFDRFCCGGFEPPKGDNIDNTGALQRMDGMTFDSNFNADYTLVFTHGQESVDAGATSFWAMSAHYAELAQDGEVVAAGIQLGPMGLPNVLRFPFGADFDNDADVDGRDFLIWQRNAGTMGGATRETGDATGEGNVDQDDLDAWESEFATSRSLSDIPFAPSDTTAPTTALIGPAIPGLSQGQLIDRNYALSSGGCTDDTGAGCIAPELEFVLDVDPAEIGVTPPNASNHRNFNNTIDLQMALNNSNTEGVSGAPGDTDPMEILPEDNPEEVLTGIEFSIPLSQIGNPTGDIKVSAFINGTAYDFLSNQFAGTGVLQGNLGADGMGGNAGDFSGVDLSTIAGDQFVTVMQAPVAVNVPEPSTAFLLLAGTLACGLSHRRRK